jgi:biofilm PGA synthesis N-glycosyltransferase PgaC
VTNGALFVLLRNMTIFFAAVMLVKYFVLLMLAAYHPVSVQIRRRRTYKQEIRDYGCVRPYNPKISIIIPAWNEAKGIIKSINSILANHYPEFEVIVVNDGSTDNSQELVNAYIDKYISAHPKYAVHHSLKQRYQQRGGKGKALNSGIEASSGEIILTVDADSALAPDALTKLAEHFRDQNVSAVVGQVRVANVHGRVIGIMQRLEYLFGFYFKRANCVMGSEYIYGGACAAFRRKHTFDFFGLFDEKNRTEDIEMSMRTKHHGLRSVYAEDVVCFTEGASNYLGLLSQRLRWKKGRFDTFLTYRRMFFSWERNHNKLLSWFILPYALLSEAQLLLEPIGATLLITYSIISGEYVSLALSMLFIGISYFIVAIFGASLSWKERIRLIALWPITWPLFYFVVWVEFQALLRGSHMVLRGDDLEWQKWQREGIN